MKTEKPNQNLDFYDMRKFGISCGRAPLTVFNPALARDLRKIACGSKVVEGYALLVEGNRINWAYLHPNKEPQEHL